MTNYTPAEIAELAGMSVNDFQNLIAAVGLPRPAGPANLRRCRPDRGAAPQTLPGGRHPEGEPARSDPSGRQLCRTGSPSRTGTWSRPTSSSREPTSTRRQSSCARPRCNFSPGRAGGRLRPAFTFPRPAQKPGDGDGQPRLLRSGRRAPRFRSASPTWSVSPGSASVPNWRRSEPWPLPESVAIEVTNPEVRLVKTII